MYWQHKAFAINILNRIPFGRRGYLLAQKLLGTTRVNPRRDLQRAAELIEMIREAGQTIEGSECYEIGTGWHPFTPLAFYLAGARRIVSVDVNPWLSLNSALQTIQSVDPHLEWFTQICQLDRARVFERYQRLVATPKADSLRELLGRFHCEYIYPGDARHTGLPDRSMDFVISSNVLEHIPPTILRDIAAEGCRILKPGGLFVHRFNPGDHYANDDPSIGTGNFLQFSELEWKSYGAGLAYHNRLRCSQFSELFAKVGLIPLIEKQRVDPTVLEALRNGTLQPHGDFADLSPEDLAADYMWYAGLQPHGTPQPLPTSPQDTDIPSAVDEPARSVSICG